MAQAGRGDAVAPGRWKAPAHWEAVDIVSDLHLGDALPRTIDAWSDFLRRCDADALLILGDLFEVWVGDDAAASPTQAPLVAALAEAARRRPLFFMVGNRDFLVGEPLLRLSHMQGLSDPCCLELPWGERVLLTHGDALCLADEPYQAFRRMVRSHAWQREFLARPLAERQEIAAGIRRRSEERRRFDGQPGIDIDLPLAQRWLDGCGATTLVHGHTHRPGTSALGESRRRHVLSDWDLDDATNPRAEVLRLQPGGARRYDPRTAPAR